MPRSLIIFVVGLLIVAARSSAAQQTPSADELSERINNLLQPAVDAELFSGIVLVARGDDIIYHQPFGYADWELRAPLTRKSRFGIASITKAMTDIIVELLLAEGQINLDMPVENYIEGFPRGPGGGVPTVRHLYTHRSGVPHRLTSDVDETQPLRTTDIVERVKWEGLRFEPGTDRLYSSAGYTVLARVIEIVEGKPYEQVLAERVFDPAGMRNAMSETGRELMTHRASPYTLGTTDGRITALNVPYKDLRFLTGAGSVYASAEDLFHYVRAMHAGVFGPELWDQAVDADAMEWRGWTGWTSGYEAYMDVLPAEDLTLLLLTNLRSMVTWQTRQAVRTLLNGDQVEPFVLPPPRAEPFESFASVTGIYNRNGSLVEIRLEEGRLFRGDNEIYPTTDERYFTPASGSFVAFRRNEQGEVEALLSPPDDEQSAMPRIE